MAIPSEYIMQYNAGFGDSVGAGWEYVPNPEYAAYVEQQRLLQQQQAQQMDKGDSNTPGTIAYLEKNIAASEGAQREGFQRALDAMIAAGVSNVMDLPYATRASLPGATPETPYSSTWDTFVPMLATLAGGYAAAGGLAAMGAGGAAGTGAAAGAGAGGATAAWEGLGGLAAGGTEVGAAAGAGAAGAGSLGATSGMVSGADGTMVGTAAGSGSPTVTGMASGGTGVEPFINTAGTGTLGEIGTGAGALTLGSSAGGGNTGSSLAPAGTGLPAGQGGYQFPWQNVLGAALEAYGQGKAGDQAKDLMNQMINSDQWRPQQPRYFDPLYQAATQGVGNTEYGKSIADATARSSAAKGYNMSGNMLHDIAKGLNTSSMDYVRTLTPLATGRGESQAPAAFGNQQINAQQGQMGALGYGLQNIFSGQQPSQLQQMFGGQQPNQTLAQSWGL